jgi:uncharacterized protein YgiM (DUF1202 family)
MKTNCWLILGTMLATSVVAQVNTNKLPEIPPPALAAPAAPAPAMAPVVTKTNAPVKKAVAKAKKKVVKKTAAVAKPMVKKLTELPVMLVPGPATVAADNVNLRGQAGLQGEVVGHVKKGDTVTILSEINLDKPKAGEPAHWAKIALPAGTKVWLDSKFVDMTNKVVAVKKLNLRGGPGENYSVLGVLEKGTALTEVMSKGDWMQIETPASAFAFVAAGYLRQEVPGMETNVPNMPSAAAMAASMVPQPAVESVPPTPTTVPEPAPVAPTTTTIVAPPTIPPTPEPLAPVVASATAAAGTAPALATAGMSVPPPTGLGAEVDTNLPPPPPRIVTHEGSVRQSVSPVAPTYFELFDPANDKAINYLFTTSTNLHLERYSGLHITVTGEEGMDARWQDTPVLTIQKIYVIPGDAPKSGSGTLKPVKKSWWGK